MHLPPTNTQLNSTETTMEYGGSTYPVKDGHTPTVTFIYLQETFSRKAINRRQITDYNSFTKCMAIISIGYPYTLLGGQQTTMEYMEREG